MVHRSAPPVRIEAGPARPLHDVAGTRRIEHAALATRPAPSLMHRAGVAVARLAAALAPHARSIWVAAGPGNNGGDGLEAAAALRATGRQVTVGWLGKTARMGADLADAHARARASDLTWQDHPPPQADLVIDALLGIGASRPPDARMAEWIAHINGLPAPVVAVDVPTGLDADTGRAAERCVRADATLSLLTLKPGLFTGRGRDVCGTVWLDRLGLDDPADEGACAWLRGHPAPMEPRPSAHKGDLGDVAVVGGATGMLGAAWLAASSALHRGAGRVFLAPLDPQAPTIHPTQPELMVRPLTAIDPQRAVVVCGCGGGDAVRAALPALLSRAPRLVLDADALNAIAADAMLQSLLQARATRGWQTVLTPHPLEAARLAGSEVAAVQADRLAAVTRLAAHWRCVVLLKGSGSVVVGPGRLPTINPTGGPALARAGTGDVLAGAIGALMARGQDAFDAAADAAWLHGRCADTWPGNSVLTAGRLAAARWD